MTHVIYSPTYNMGTPSLNRLHPFDSRKYEKIWAHLQQEFGETLKKVSVAPPDRIAQSDLLAVHTQGYLNKLRHSAYVAQVLELSMIEKFPRSLIDLILLKPMRWATAGTVLGAKSALLSGFAVNLGGGFHHAKPNSGEGFCVFADIALAINSAWSHEWLKTDDNVAYIDLDAHLGNGVSHCFIEDRRVHIFDMYNSQIYPQSDYEAVGRVDYPLPLLCGCEDDTYLTQLQENLPYFLDQLISEKSVGLAIYNAGTDIFRDDPLGMMGISAVGILDRDLFVVNELRKRNIPTLMLLSGGYTKESWKLSANSITQILRDLI